MTKTATPQVTGIRIGVDGELSRVDLPRHELADESGTPPLLAAMYESLDCRIVEVVSLWDSVDMWADEEGLLVANPEVNTLATWLASCARGAFSPIVGNVILLGANEATGATRSLSGDEFLRGCQRKPLSDYLPYWLQAAELLR